MTKLDGCYAPGGTHHHACECREAGFAQLQQEHTAYKRALEDIAAHDATTAFDAPPDWAQRFARGVLMLDFSPPTAEDMARTLQVLAELRAEREAALEGKPEGVKAE